MMGTRDMTGWMVLPGQGRLAHFKPLPEPSACAWRPVVMVWSSHRLSRYPEHALRFTNQTLSGPSPGRVLLRSAPRRPVAILVELC